MRGAGGVRSEASLYFLHGGETGRLAEKKGAKIAWCVTRNVQVSGDDGLNYSEHKCNDESQVTRACSTQHALHFPAQIASHSSPADHLPRIRRAAGAVHTPPPLTSKPLFRLKFDRVCRYARAVCGSSVALQEAVAAVVGGEVVAKLQRSELG